LKSKEKNKHTQTTYYTGLIKFFNKIYSVLHGWIVNVMYKITKMSPQIVKVYEPNNKEQQQTTERVQEVTHTSTIRLKQSNRYFKVTTKLYSNINTPPRETKITQRGNYINENSNIATKIEFLTNGNNHISDMVVNNWDKLSNEVKEKIKKLAEVQFNYEEIMGNLETFTRWERFLITFSSIIRLRNLGKNYKESADRLIRVVLEATEGRKITLSIDDAEIFIKTIENPKDFSDKVKLDIKEFRKKYNI